MELNPVLLPLDWLLGTWESDEPGEGCFPSIKPFNYTETLHFSHVGQPVINFMYVIVSNHTAPHHLPPLPASMLGVVGDEL